MLIITSVRTFSTRGNPRSLYCFSWSQLAAHLRSHDFGHSWPAYFVLFDFFSLFLIMALLSTVTVGRGLIFLSGWGLFSSTRTGLFF